MTETQETYEVAKQEPRKNGDIQVSNFYHLMDRALESENAIEVIERLYTLKEKEEDKEAKRAFNTAMVEAQKKMPTIPKDADNQQTNSKYSRLETIIKHAKPIYTDHGFSLSFYEGETSKENHIRLMVDVMHSAGHTETKWYDVPIDSTGIKGTVNKTGPHAKASSDSYARRYLTCMIFNIPTGIDDDGNAAGGKTITKELAKEIEDLAAEVKANEKKFFEYWKIKQYADLPISKFGEAKAMLNAKRKPSNA